MLILNKPSLPLGKLGTSPLQAGEKNMVILAIETSCDETSVAVLEARNSSAKFLSHLVASQIKLHARTGGVVPEVAARAHLENIIPLTQQALSAAGCRLSDIGAIAVTAGPGLQPSLMVGVDTAKALSLALKIPITAINHIEAHIFSPLLANSQFPIPNSKKIFPAVSLVVSGGHTELFLVTGWLKYKKLGATLDDAAGECFDKTAKLLGLPYPGGPELSRLAQRGRPVVNFPRPLMNAKNFNFSFSGLKTAVLYYLRDFRDANDANLTRMMRKKTNSRHLYKFVNSHRFKADIAASVEAAIIDVLVSKTLAAARQYKTKTIMLGGGVAANQSLRQKLKNESKKMKIKLLIASPQYCTDNAAMIAFVGFLHARENKFTTLNKVRANSNWEL